MLPYTRTDEVKKLLKESNAKKVSNAKKATDFDIISLKLVKSAAGVLAVPLSKTVNNSISKGVFPNKTQIALVFPLDKNQQRKNLF